MLTSKIESSSGDIWVSQCFLMYFFSFSSLSPTLLSNVGAFGVVITMNVGEIREAGKNGIAINNLVYFDISGGFLKSWTSPNF